MRKINTLSESLTIPALKEAGELFYSCPVATQSEFETPTVLTNYTCKPSSNHFKKLVLICVFVLIGLKGWGQYYLLEYSKYNKMAMWSGPTYKGGFTNTLSLTGISNNSFSGNTSNCSDANSQYPMSTGIQWAYEINDSILNLFTITNEMLFTLDQYYSALGSNMVKYSHEESFSFTNEGGSIKTSTELANACSDANCQVQITSYSITTIHPLYKLVIEDRFHSSNENLNVTIKQKGKTKIVPNTSNYTWDKVICPTSYSSKYSATIEIGKGSSPITWSSAISNFYDPSDNTSYAFNYNTIKSLLGSEILGEELKIRCRQTFNGSNITSTPISFYYLPQLTLDSYSKTDISCKGDSTGSVSFNIGNLPSTTSGSVKFLYLVYQYDKVGSTAISSIKNEDTAVWYNDWYKFSRAYTSTSGESLSNNVTVNNLKAGIYKIKVYSLCNDTMYYPAEAVVEITEPSQLLNNSIATNNWTYNSNTYQVATGAISASITLAATGGTAWNPLDASNLYYQYGLGTETPVTAFYPSNASSYLINAPASSSAATQNITIQDAHGCLAAKTLSLKQADPIVISGIVPYNATCNSSDLNSTPDGAATITFSGGAGNYTLVYTSANQNITQTQPDAGSITYSNFAPGDYTVSITDVTGGPAVTGTFTIGQPDRLVIDNISIPAIACASDLASATIITQNSNVFYYAVGNSNAVSSETSNIFSKNLTPGDTYQFYLQRSANQCKSASIAGIMPAAPLPIAITSIATDVSCDGATNGAFIITASGGWPYTGNEYQFNTDGTNYTLSESASRQNLAVNDYIVTVKDALCGVPYSATITVGTVKNQLKIASTSVTSDLCKYRESTDRSGAIDLIIDKGDRATSGYKATLYDSNDLPIKTSLFNDNNLRFSQLEYGTFRVEVSDVNGCSASETTTISTDPNQIHLQSEPVTTSTLCPGVTNGQLSVTATGGNVSSGYLFQLTDNNNILKTNNTGHFTSLAAGSYTLRVSDDSTCYITSTVRVAASPTPVIFTNVSYTPIFCENRLGTIQTNAATNADNTITTVQFTYPSNISESVSTNGKASRTELKNEGKYVITATDNIGCKADTSVTLVNYKNNPTITLEAVDSAACSAATNGRFLFSASQVKDIGGFVYTLAGNSITPSGNSAEYSGLPAKTYQLSVTDSMGCSTVNSFVLPIINTPVQIKSFAITQASCIRAANAKISLEAMGSIADNEGYHFVWNNKDTLFGKKVEFTNHKVGGSNSVVLYDKYGCSDATPSFAFPVRTDSLSIALISKTNPSCPAYADGILAFQSINNDSSTTGYSYQLFQTNNTTPVQLLVDGWKYTFKGLTEGTYHAIVTSPDNCQAYSSEVNIAEPDTIQLSVNPGYVAAKGASTGWASALATKGNQKYIFEWYQGPSAITTSLISSQTSVSSAAIVQLPAGNYLVRVKDTANCQYWNSEWLTKSFTIAEPANSLSLALANTDTVTCNGLSNGSFSVQGVGGWGSQYSYGTDANFTNGNSPKFTGLVAGTYTFYVKDTSGITTSASFTMTEPKPLTATIASVTNANCYGSSDGSIELSVNGGNNTFSVSSDETTWYKGLVLPSIQAGIYTVVVRDNKDCTSKASATVGQPSAIVVTDTTITNTQCQVKEGSITATISGGIPAYAYQWYNNNTLIGQGKSSIDSLYSGQYLLYTTDSHGCLQKFTFNISDLTNLEINTFATLPVSCYGSSDGSATATIDKGFPPYSLYWTGNVQGNSVNNLTAGTYLFYVIDSEGCKVYKNFTIETPDSLHIVTDLITNPLCNGVADGTIEVSATGGTPDYSYLWNTGRAKHSISKLDIGNYSVTLSDAHQCSTQKLFSLGYSEKISSGIPKKITLCKNNDYTLDGGDFAYYLWKLAGNELSQTRQLAVNSTGEYTLDVEDSRGCTTTDTIRVGLSETELQAQFLMASEVLTTDTVIIFEASEPVPDSINLALPTSFHIIDSGQYYRYFTVSDTGTFNVSMVSYFNDCQDVISKTLHVTEAGIVEASGENAKVSLIVSAVLSPNPNDGNFKVDLELSGQHDAYLRLVSFGTGVTLSSRKVSGYSSYSIPYNMGKLTPGAYLLNIRVENEMKNLKIIIQ